MFSKFTRLNLAVFSLLGSALYFLVLLIVPTILSKLSLVSYDLVLLDISMPGKEGFAVLKEIKLKWKSIPVMIFTMKPEEIHAVKMFQNGAVAYVNKRINPEQLFRILRIVAAGNNFYFPRQVQLLANSLRK